MTAVSSILVVLLMAVCGPVQARSGYFASYLSASQKNRQPKPIFRTAQTNMRTEESNGGLKEIGSVLVTLKKEMMAMRTEVIELHEQSSAVWRKLEQLQENQLEDEFLLAEEIVKKNMNSTKTNIGEKSCLSGYIKNADGDGCMRLAGERVSWQTAFNRCKLDGASLVKVNSARKQRFIAQKANENEKTQQCDFWLGAVRPAGSNSEWIWSDDEPLSSVGSYTNWNPDEPNNSSGSEHCSQMLWLFSWRWNDLSCKGKRACYICETDLV